MPRKTPITWTHQEVSVLTKLHGLHGDTPEGLRKTEKSFERHTVADVRDKMIELELIAKPTKPALTEAEMQIIRDQLGPISTAVAEPTRTVAVRYAIEQLQTLLPKRVKREPIA